MLKISLLSLLLSTNLIVNAGPITKDTDLQHDHKPEYFSKLKLKAVQTPNGQPLQVHLVPHSHDDVGWLKTVDLYFSGSAYKIQQAGVELIISTVINELIEDPNKRFSQVEMKFFSMWWKDQTEDLKNKVRQLVQQGRLEFLNAGWSMSDEACPHYEDFINNMLHGHQFLMDEFGVRPRVGWHIDPFGHSNASPRLFADMGFDAWFFARLDYQDKDRRLASQEMEFLWRPMYEHHGFSKQIFTHALYHHYSAPRGFNFDSTSEDDAIVDNPNLQTYNLDTKVAAFRDYITHQADHYKNTGHLFVVMGDDFQYSNAKMNFKSMDRLIKGFNSRYGDIQLRYSTPSEYLNAIGQLDIKWPTKYDDMFPYADEDFSYWTGYFTSRANDKEYMRRGSANLHASSKLYSFQAIDKYVTRERLTDVLNAKNIMMDVMGISQHHDAVTGTGKQAVANDYAYKLFKALESNNKLFAEIITESATLFGTDVKPNGTYSWCFRENSTYLDCPIKDYDFSNPNFTYMMVAAFNPSLQMTNYTKIAVPHGKLKIEGYNPFENRFDDYSFVSDVICDSDTFDGIKVDNNCWLYVPIQGFPQSTIFIKISYNAVFDLTVKVQTKAPIQIQSLYEQILYTGTTEENGQEFTITKLLQASQKFNVSFDLRYWNSYQGDVKATSGVYMFSSDWFQYDSLRYSQLQSVSYQAGKVIQQITFVYNDELTQQSATVKLRLYKQNPVSEWNVKLDGIPLTNQGQEVTVNFKSLDIDHNNTFWTDANGLAMQKRILNYRSSWDYQSLDNITSNYYPVNTAIAILDNQTQNQMTVMNSRSQGGSVLRPSRIELMHNRRMYYDDHRGMGEALNETDASGQGITVISNYYLHVFNRLTELSEQRNTQIHTDEPLQYFFNFQMNQGKQAENNKLASKNGIKLKDFVLPTTAKLELFPMNKNNILMRIENIADKFDADQASAPTEYVQINEIAKAIYGWQDNIVENLAQVIISETTLTANQLFTQMESNKIQWTGVDDDFLNPPVQPADKSLYEIALPPQSIRTFLVQYILKPKKNVQGMMEETIEAKDFLN